MHFINWQYNQASIIELYPDSLRCKFEPFDINSNWKSIEYSEPKETSKLYLGKKDKIIYILGTEATFVEPHPNDVNVKRVKSAKYALVRIDFETGQVMRKNLDSILGPDTFLYNASRIGNNEFVLFVSEKTRKKNFQYYLYKIILE